MKTGSFRAWYRPRTILVVSDVSEHPAHTLQAITQLRATGARLFLLPLRKSNYETRGAEGGLSYLVFNHESNLAEPSPDHTRRALLWAEILSDATVLKSAPLEQVAAIAESIHADIVVVVSPDSSSTRFSMASFEFDLLGSVQVPILIFGKYTDISSWSTKSFRSILLPITFGPGLASQFRFACQFARRYQARLTVLHVFESREPNGHSWERTPVAVEARLPISELKRERILCPMEIAVCEGYPERAILRFNERKHHDLIIMGCPRSEPLRRRFGHSVVRGVIAEARCPVLVIGGAVEAHPASAEPESLLTRA
jgi:nucleotide-binding universal stress UspA family protein